MVLSLSQRFTPATLPRVGQVVAHVNGPAWHGNVVVEGISTSPRGLVWVQVRTQSGEQRRLQLKSLRPVEDGK